MMTCGLDAELKRTFLHSFRELVIDPLGLEDPPLHFMLDFRAPFGSKSLHVNPSIADRPSYLYRGNGRSGFAGFKALVTTFSAIDKIVFSPGDFTGDGFSDVMMVHGYGGSVNDYRGWLVLDAGDGHGDMEGQGYGLIGSGWGKMRSAFGPGDFFGDRKNDVMAITSTGDLYLFRGNAFVNYVAWSAPAQKIGSGWGSFLTVFSRGDSSGDGKTDVMAVSEDGGLYLYRGNGRGGFAAAGQRIGNGWNVFR